MSVPLFRTFDYSTILQVHSDASWIRPYSSWYDRHTETGQMLLYLELHENGEIYIFADQPIELDAVGHATIQELALQDDNEDRSHSVSLKVRFLMTRPVTEQEIREALARDLIAPPA